MRADLAERAQSATSVCALASEGRSVLDTPHHATLLLDLINAPLLLAPRALGSGICTSAQLPPPLGSSVDMRPGPLGPVGRWTPALLATAGTTAGQCGLPSLVTHIPSKAF